jgi:hypothetical protein
LRKKWQGTQTQKPRAFMTGATMISAWAKSRGLGFEMQLSEGTLRYVGEVKKLPIWVKAPQGALLRELTPRFLPGRSGEIFGHTTMLLSAWVFFKCTE